MDVRLQVDHLMAESQSGFSTFTLALQPMRQRENLLINNSIYLFLGHKIELVSFGTNAS